MNLGLAGDTIGRYELLLELGRGGMAVLYLARARGAGGFARLFAIKRILPHLAADPLFVDMFLDEGRIAARLSHPNLCPVFEIGHDAGELFLVMEYLDGVPWEALAAPRDAPGRELRADLRLGLAAGVLAQACEGLHHAHTFRDVDGTAMPIIHRDVSPQNLFVSVDGVCRVLDFGVSKVATDHRRTRTGVRKGKLPYMAPEQIRGEPLDGRADVWAVGVMLWEALTGARLFDRDTDFLIYQAITDMPIPSVNAPRAPAGPRYPGAVDRVIARALARDRDRRHATARELGRDLLQVAGEVGGAASHESIANAVRALCGDQLDARKQAISTAVARRAATEAAAAARNAATEPGAGARPPAGPPVGAADAAETVSMEMRRDAIVVEHRRRRRWIAPAAGLAVILGAVAAISAWRDGSAAVSTSPSNPVPGSMAADDSRGSASAASTAAPGAARSGVSPSAPPPAGGSASPVPATPARRSPVRPAVVAAGTRPAAPGGAASTSPHAGVAAPPRSRDRAAHDATGSEPAAATPATGWYAIDSAPYATIFIDDRKIGDTPLDRISLPAGSHRVRAVLADGRQRTFAIDIAPDRKTSAGTLTW